MTSAKAASHQKHGIDRIDLPEQWTRADIGASPKSTAGISPRLRMTRCWTGPGRVACQANTSRQVNTTP